MCKRHIRIDTDKLSMPMSFSLRAFAWNLKFAWGKRRHTASSERKQAWVLKLVEWFTKYKAISKNVIKSTVGKENEDLSIEDISFEEQKPAEYLNANAQDQPLRAAWLANVRTAEMTSNSPAFVPSFSSQILLNALSVNKA